MNQPLSLICSPGPNEHSVRSSDGKVLTPPKDWKLLAPGDPALTRRVKLAGPHWIVQEKKGRKIFSKGIWAQASTIESIRQDLEQERSTESYAKKRQGAAIRREVKQATYVDDFLQTVLDYLKFHPKHSVFAEKLAKAVTAHATPVGSGTVARTERIPIERRAEAAVIAWMRHQTSAYDQMKIPRVKGMRREVRRMLAQRSKELLDQYRQGVNSSELCPLARALKARD
jgi:hypothetical protein